MNIETQRRTIPSAIKPKGNIPTWGVLPNLKIIKIGGQSIMDRGAEALMPLRDEIIEAAKKHPLLICAGGGTRARHAYGLGIDLKLPTGIMSELGAAVPRQNARMLQMLLARWGGIYIMPDDIEKLPLYLSMKSIPIIGGMPPFSYWEKPAIKGTIPEHRTDSGPFLLGEFFGTPEVYLVKDEDGLYDDNPKTNPKAQHIPEITAQELLSRNLPDLVLERVVVEHLCHARVCKRVRVFNGLKRGELMRALDGEAVGSVIKAEA
ncbi:MAG: uridine kinase [Myxococcota bacterium]